MPYEAYLSTTTLPSPRVCFSSFSFRNFHLDPPTSIVLWRCCMHIHELANCSDNGRTSDSMNAVVGERTPYLRRARGRYGPCAPAWDGCGLPPRVLHKNAHCRTVRGYYGSLPLPPRKECIVYRLFSMLAACESGLEVLVVSSALALIPVISLLPGF